MNNEIIVIVSVYKLFFLIALKTAFLNVKLNLIFFLFERN